MNLDVPKTEKIIEEKLSEIAILKDKVVTFDDIKDIDRESLSSERDQLQILIETHGGNPKTRDELTSELSILQSSKNDIINRQVRVKENMMTTSNIISTNTSKIDTLQREISNASSDNVNELIIELDNNIERQNRLKEGQEIIEESLLMSQKISLEARIELYEDNIPSADFEETDLDNRLSILDKDIEMTSNTITTLEHTVEDYRKVVGLIDVSTGFTPVSECQSCPLFSRFGQYVSSTFDSESLSATLRDQSDNLVDLVARRESIVEKIAKRQYYQTVMERELSTFKCTINELVGKHHVICSELKNELDNMLGIMRFHEIERDNIRLRKRINVDDNIKTKEQNISMLRDQNNQYVISQTSKRVELDSLSVSIEELNDKITKVNGLLSVFSNQDRIIEIDNLLTKLGNYGSDAERLNDLTIDLGTFKIKRDNLHRELNKINYRMRQYDELNKRLTKVENGVKITTKIERSSSPITGIPSIEMNLFLGDDIKEDINDFISLFFQDSLYVAKFEINQKDFDILVKGGEVSRQRDASMCSKGEQRMLAIALSFALQGRAFDRSICRYDIITLDEMDSGLDVYKQSIFLSSLEKYFQSTGNCSQVFMTSHTEVSDGIRANYFLTRGFNTIKTGEINPDDIIFQHE